MTVDVEEVGTYYSSSVQPPCPGWAACNQAITSQSGPAVQCSAVSERNQVLIVSRQSQGGPGSPGTAEGPGSEVVASRVRARERGAVRHHGGH